MMDRLIALFVAAQGSWRREEGQTAVEYALVLVLVAVVLAGSLAALSGALDGVVADIKTSLGV